MSSMMSTLCMISRMVSCYQVCPKFYLEFNSNEPGTSQEGFVSSKIPSQDGKNIFDGAGILRDSKMQSPAEENSLSLTNSSYSLLLSYW
jgi:hypothetical protein